MGKLLKWIFFGFLGLAGLGMVLEANMTPEQKAEAKRHSEEKSRVAAQNARDQAKAELASMPSVTASTLASAYEQNTVAADKAFKGKKFKVSGTVQDINTDLFGNPYLTLKGGVNQFMEPQFSFDKGASDALGSLQRGMKVQLVCVGNGDVAKTPMSESCILM